MDAIEKALARVPDKTYFRIGEVSRITKVKPYVLRFWETEFKMMVPPKSRSQQRMYRKKDIETILRIKQLLYKERFTIEGARKRLNALRRAESGDQTTQNPSGGLRKIHRELEAIREFLAEV